MANNLKLIGAERMRRTFRRLRQSGPLMRPIAAQLFQEGERIMARSKKQVPVDLGNLRATGFVEPPEIDGFSVSVTLGYGGTAGPGETFPRPDKLPTGKVGYAVVVHEDQSINHKTGSALYLERPFLDEAPSAERRLGTRIRGFIRDNLQKETRQIQ